ncbi:2-hydroxyacid dehydrogenase [Microbacterium gorillae]|uniref:2-hydroxyacid dehydrogenase n=1 Tax=Microbacterium gorillae TaxID=1231063 RepID=UPI00058AE0A4|nr:2-hydroxyacid dehydrogenase [Microbacterium gorillae]
MTKLSVSLPTERLRDDVTARLGERAAEVELLLWDMSGAAPRSEIDLAVPPYMKASAALPQLDGVRTRLVQGQSIGYDDVPAHLPPGHVFANASSVHETATSEMALTLVLASQRRIPEFVRQQDAEAWRPRFSPSLADRRVLVLGFGGVGKAVVSRLEPFEVDIVPVASHAREEAGRQVHGIDELAELLPTADIVILTLPDTAETRHLINDEALSALPDGALVVNVGRGPLIDTDALIDHLQRGRIRAALDVTDPEPLPEGHPLWQAPNTLIVPHVGGAASSMQPRIAQLVATQIVRMLDGEDPINVVFES